MQHPQPSLTFFATCAIMAFFCSFGIAPSTTISGTVYGENKKPLANVEVINTTNNFVAISDKHGNFSIRGKKGNLLKVNFANGSKTIRAAKIRKLHIYPDKAQPVNNHAEKDKIKIAELGDADEGILKEALGLDVAMAGRVSGVQISGSVTEYRDGDKSSSVGYSSKQNAQQRAGQLTAGEVNDFSKWSYWEDLTQRELNQWKAHWSMSPTFRFSVILSNKRGYPIVNKTVHLVNNSGARLWTCRTDNTGRAELWYEPSGISLDKIPESLYIADSDNTRIVEDPKEFRDGINVYSYPQKCNELQKVNIAFMVDATGSMGDEIAYLQAEMNDVIQRTKKALPDVELSLGSVFYKDQGDDYVVKNFDFTKKVPDAISFIGHQGANGGGDTPEAVTEAFGSAIDSLDWDDDARAKLLFVVLDAPPHHTAGNIEKLQALARKAAEKGIRIIPISASGIDKSTEYLMRAMALQTNGTYLFITNHSGIGNDHIAPSTDSYKVEMLNDLILRVILQFTAISDCSQDDTEYPTNTKIEQQLLSKSEIKWSYYPNPTSGIVTIELGQEASNLQLFDTTGKLVLFQDTRASRYQMDLSGLPNAIYYLKANVGDKILVGKISKKI